MSIGTPAMRAYRPGIAAIGRGRNGTAEIDIARRHQHFGLDAFSIVVAAAPLAR